MLWRFTPSANPAVGRLARERSPAACLIHGERNAREHRRDGSLRCGRACSTRWHVSHAGRRKAATNAARPRHASASGAKCARESARRKPPPSLLCGRAATPINALPEGRTNAAKALRQRQSRTRGSDRTVLCALRRRRERADPCRPVHGREPREDAPLTKRVLRRLRRAARPREMTSASDGSGPALPARTRRSNRMSPPADQGSDLRAFPAQGGP